MIASVARAVMPAAPRFVSAFRTSCSASHKGAVGPPCEPRPEEAVFRGQNSKLMRLFATVCLALALSSGLIAAENPSAPSAWLRQLRFSPDGHYVLAQDNAEITLLTVRPLAILFRMPAENATLAQFTVDSAEVVFASSIPVVDAEQVMVPQTPAHVERWQVADRARTGFVEVPLQACGTVALSPDGRVVVCDQFDGTLRLIDVASAATIFEKKKFAKREYLGTPNRPCIELPPNETVVIATRPGLFRNSCYSGDPGSTIVGFSPDARFVIAEPESEGPAIAWDISQRRAIPLAGALRQLLKSSQRGLSYALPFAIVAPDLVLVCLPDASRSKKDKKEHVELAELVSFPSGAVVSKMKFPMSLRLFAAADPSFVLVRPFGGPAAGYPFTWILKSTRAAAMQFKSGDEIIINNQLALDVFGQYYVAEPNPGEVGLYERGKGIQVAVVLHPK